MTYFIYESRLYQKSFKKISESKEFTKTKLDLLNEVINILSQGEKLSASHGDHQLKGKLKDFRECHIGFNLLLVYQVKERELILILINIGTHDKLFDR